MSSLQTSACRAFDWFSSVLRLCILWMCIHRYMHVIATNSPESDSCKETDTSEDAATDATPLARARRLRPPLATETSDGEFEHAEFWEENGSLIKEAWKEWEKDLMKNTKKDQHSEINEIYKWLNTKLSHALDEAFAFPCEENENEVKSFWTTFTNLTSNSKEKYTTTTTTTTTTKTSTNNNSHDNNRPLPKGVYATTQNTPLLTPQGIRYIRTLFSLFHQSGIPTRRPNGMNRNGVIIDPNVDGAIPMDILVKFVQEILVEKVVRPIGRMLFPEYVGCSDDVEYFAFTIQYDGDDDDDDDKGGISCDGNKMNDNNSNTNVQTKDLELKEHRDASVITLSVNLNLPEEGYDGSQVFFRPFPALDSSEGSVAERTPNSAKIATSTTNINELLDNNICKPEQGCGTVAFTPGMAIVHLGAHRHGSLPIESSPFSSNEKTGSIDKGGRRNSKRFNLVIWLFGKDGDVRIAPYPKEEQMNLRERWLGCNEKDSFVGGEGGIDFLF